MALEPQEPQAILEAQVRAKESLFSYPGHLAAYISNFAIYLVNFKKGTWNIDTMLKPS